MGMYINPNGSKGAWAIRHGERINLEEAKAHNDFKEKFLCVLVDNGFFRAFGVAYDERERNDWISEFDRPNPRPMEFYIADKKDILKVVSEHDVKILNGAE